MDCLIAGGRFHQCIQLRSGTGTTRVHHERMFCCLFDETSITRLRAERGGVIASVAEEDQKQKDDAGSNPDDCKTTEFLTLLDFLPVGTVHASQMRLLLLIVHEKSSTGVPAG